jgi:tetratricopeptide (TPR) repeat protein
MALTLVLGCTRTAKLGERTREAVHEALSRGDRGAALVALKDLQKILPHEPESLLELSTFLVSAGDAPQALWLLEGGIRDFQERDDLRLALAHVALLVGDASAARMAAAVISAGSQHFLNAQLILALAELQLGNLERALAILEDAERLYPERREARLARVGTLLAERRFKDAHNVLVQAKQALPVTGHGQELERQMDIALYAIQAAQGESDAAIVGLRKLVDEHPSDILAWHSLVQAYWKAGRGEEALELLRTSLESDPEQIALYRLAAPLYAAFDQRAQAELALREAVRRSPSAIAYLELALFFTANDNVESGLEILREALHAFPDEPLLRKHYAETLITRGNIEAAKIEIERFRVSSPDDPNVDYLRARLELAQGDPVMAASRLNKLVSKLDQAATHFWLGQALEAMGDQAGAERRYTMAVARQPSDPTLYLTIIRLAERRGDWRAVSHHAQQLVRRQPRLFDGWSSLLTALLKLGEGQKAEEIASKAVKLFPDRPEPHLLLASAFRTQGRFTEALEQLARVPKRFERTEDV